MIEFSRQKVDETDPLYGDGHIYRIRIFNFVRYICVAQYPINRRRRAYALFDNHMDAYDFICDQAGLM